ncbi:hypothetical protein ULMS_27480 [Patiriisocius marinistellae]|uniref:RND transporter n=1 Tax=Patiriisocius marinistellae TaxID=2494560 RepID=A0A5J4FYA6_9FLAO|nr:hypothetical protein [Patiriisocius marinistellae]GEQ87240.1 hypothetical protein ULMS_27480 [Patiriisocius marinistellae]
MLNNPKLILLLCLTLGLAPFFPEPHIWGKLKWIAGGAEGMVLKDWFDVLLHGAPFILLIRIVLLKLGAFNKK